MSTQTTIAIDFVRRRLRGLEASMRRGTLVVKSAVSIAMPSSIDIENDTEVGTWIGQTLREAGIRGTRALIAVNREHAVVRALDLPTRENDELPDMVGLAMKRDLPIDADDAVIDFIPVSHEEASTQVLACALPKRVVQRVDEICAAAGLQPSRISLRCFGTAALLKSAQVSRGRPILAIDLGEDGFEFVIACDGRIGYTRGVEVRPGEVGTDETIVTEIRRSWISHRLADSADEEVTRGLLLAPRDLASRLERWIGEATGLEISIVTGHPRVSVPESFPGDIWPLAGMLLREGTKEPSIDFGAPRKAPDFRAQRRQRVLLAGGALLLAVGAGWTIGNLELAKEQSRNSELQQKAASALSEYHANRRDVFRVEHLEAWQTIEPDWLSHLTALHGYAPDPSRVVLDEFNGTLLADDITWDTGGGFEITSRVRMQLDGEGEDRATIDELRTQLVDNEAYVLRSTGAETEGGRRLAVPFSFLLQAPTVLKDEDDTP